MKKTYLTYKLMMLALPLLAGCGGGGNDTPAPIGSTITINPSMVEWTLLPLPPCPPAAPAPAYSYHALLISVISPGGRPVSGATIDITVDQSLPTSLDDYNRLYDDPAWIAGSNTAPTAQVTGNYRTTTSDNGTKRMIVGVGLCGQKSNFNVFSGNAFGTISLEVN